MSISKTHLPEPQPKVLIDDKNAIKEQDMFLISLLLDANRTIDGWQKFLDAFCQHFSLNSCHLYIANMDTLAIRFQEFSGRAPSDYQMKEYMEKYFETDYTHMAILQGKPNQWFATNLMPNKDEIYAAPVYTDWVVPNGIAHMAGATLFRDDIWSCVFIHNRGIEHEEYTPDEISRCNALSLYIEKAVRLRLELAERTNHKHRLHAVLNQFRLPTAVLNEFGEVVTQNSAMEKFIGDQQSLSMGHDNYLRLNEEVCDKKLQMGIAQTVSKAKGKELTYENDGITLEIQGECYTIGFQELLETDNDTQNVMVGAMVYIASPKYLNTISAQKLQMLFQLTPSEAQCCQLFCSGLSLKDIASHEQKSIHTVREQIKNSFRKTGTSNQLELVNFISSLPSE